MKILALMSSYRKNGNTDRIVKMIGTHLEARAAQKGTPLTFETLYLGHMDLRPCRGCRLCFDRGEDMCPQKDDLRTIAAKMSAVDGMIVASPVYVNDVNGIAKTWIDRLAYLCHRPGLAGTCVYLVATVADSPTNHALRSMSVALRTWGAHIVGQAGLKMGARMEEEALHNRYDAKTLAIATTLFDAVAQQKFMQPSFFSLMTFRIQQQAWHESPSDALDYAYWRDQGWLDPARTFYIEHHAHPVKVALARLTGAIMYRFVA